MLSALGIKFVKALGYELAIALAGFIQSAIVEAYTDRVIAESVEKLKLTQEERRALLNQIKKENDPVQRRLLISSINKLR